MTRIFGSSVAAAFDTVSVGAYGKAGFRGASYVFVNGTSADLLVALGQDKTTVKQGDLLTCTLTVRNFGPNWAANLVVTDALSSDVTFVGAHANRGKFTAPPVGQNGVVTWSLQGVAPSSQEDAQITVTVIVRGKGTITNSATVSSDSPDSYMLNNSASITTTVKPGNGGK